MKFDTLLLLGCLLLPLFFRLYGKKKTKKRKNFPPFFTLFFSLFSFNWAFIGGRGRRQKGGKKEKNQRGKKKSSFIFSIFFFSEVRFSAHSRHAHCRKFFFLPFSRYIKRGKTSPKTKKALEKCLSIRRQGRVKSSGGFWAGLFSGAVFARLVSVLYFPHSKIELSCLNTVYAEMKSCQPCSTSWVKRASQISGQCDKVENKEKKNTSVE
jgi:hypothetical protein